MNNKEMQKKFAQQSNIRNSEFDRLNTNATRQSNPVGKGQNFVPKDFFRKGNDNSLIYISKYVVTSILLFFIQNFLGKLLLSSATYSSVTFLIVVLIISAYLPKLLYRK